MHKPVDDAQAFEELLTDGFLKPPENFTVQVMLAVQTLPLSTAHQPEPITWRTIAKWLALLGGAALGAAELVTFVFGLWAASAAV